MNKTLLGTVLGAFTFASLGALAPARAEGDPPAKSKKKGKHKGGDKSCSGDKKGGDKSCSGDKKQ